MSTLKALAPLDKSTRDRIVLPHLVRLATQTGATIHLLHVIPTAKTLLPHAVQSAESYVDAFEAQLTSRGIDAHAIVRKGEPAAEIVKVADEYEVDVIVMSTRGRRGLDKLFIGSVAEDIMSRCARPLTLINEATARGAMDEKMWAQSSYMAGIVWNNVAKGIFSDEQARADLQRLAALGLDYDLMNSTYNTLQQAGGAAEWLDLDFQLDTLEAYMPEALKGKQRAA